MTTKNESSETKKHTLRLKRRLSVVSKTFFVVCCFVFLSFNALAQTDTEFLARQISRGDTEQKRNALAEVRNRRTADASRLAVPALRDSSEIVRATAAGSVVFLSADEAAPFLLPLLSDKKPLVRREAAYALGKVRATSAINPLIKILQTDKVLEVRAAATAALGEIGDVAAISELLKILQRKSQTKEEFLRRSAARSIGQIAQIIQTGESEILTPENFLPEKYKSNAKPSYDNLIEAFPAFRPAISALVAALENSAEFADVRREAAFALGAIGDESAISILERNQRNEDYYLAEICREALRKISAANE